MKIVKSQFKKPWTTWSKIPKKVRATWFREWKKYVYWDPSDDEHMEKAFNKRGGKRLTQIFSIARKIDKRPGWMGETLWNELRQKRLEDPDHMKICAQNAANLGKSWIAPYGRKHISRHNDDEDEPRAEMIWNEAKAIREVQEILNYDGTPIPISELTDAKVLALALGSWSKKGRICGLSFLNELPFSGFRGQDIAGSSRGFEDEINTMRQRVDELNQAIRARVEFERSQRANRERELRREFKEELRDLKRSHKSAKMMIAWKSIMSAQQKMFEKLSWIIDLMWLKRQHSSLQGDFSYAPQAEDGGDDDGSDSSDTDSDSSGSASSDHLVVEHFFEDEV
ncbi:hypothetical protein CDL15_Pgr013009 [Punica granatum]|uniref:Uncharacterized protein n=1 Tax=Punica granatum TaxID=22663 RepID=A0A218XFG0_PUNGR|nr:hypothetical protein CDL15_Pgr013009 [Punica granatum]